MNNKTLMFYINAIHDGGAERVMLQLCGRFAALGYRCVLVTSFRDDFEYPVPEGVERLSIENEQSRAGKLRKNLSRIAALRKLCKEYRPAALISFMAEPNMRALIATMGLPIKNIVSVRNVPEKEYAGRVLGFVGRHLLPRADGCVFQTEDAKSWFPEKLQRKSMIIMNQVSRIFFDEPPALEKRDIITAGRLAPQKNQSLLIRAYARLENCSDRLIIYGMGELQQELEALIKELGLEGRVILAGQSSNIPRDIKSAKIFVLPSDFEGMPNALLEAMALGLCCVSTDCPCGGPRAVIDSGVNGVLFPVGDEQALTLALQELLDDGKKRSAMAAAAAESAKDFSPDKIFEKWRAYVERVIAG